MVLPRQGRRHAPTGHRGPPIVWVVITRTAMEGAIIARAPVIRAIMVRPVRVWTVVTRTAMVRAVMIRPFVVWPVIALTVLVIAVIVVVTTIARRVVPASACGVAITRAYRIAILIVVHRIALVLRLLAR